MARTILLVLTAGALGASPSMPCIVSAAQMQAFVGTGLLKLSIRQAPQSHANEGFLCRPEIRYQHFEHVGMPPRIDVQSLLFRRSRVDMSRGISLGNPLDALGDLFNKPMEEVSVLALPKLRGSETAVVWFTSCDLRVHDHEGLAAAAGAGGVVPLFVFDKKELAAESVLDATYLYHAVTDLRRSLRHIGSDLVIRSGDAAVEVADVVRRSGATHLFYHSSPVHTVRSLHLRATSALQEQGGGLGEAQGEDGSISSNSVTIYPWSTQLWRTPPKDISRMWNYRDHEREWMKGPVRSAFPTPESLPPLPSGPAGGGGEKVAGNGKGGVDTTGGIETGDMPTLESVLESVGSSDPEVQKSLLLAAGEEAPFGALALCKEGFGESKALELLDLYLEQGETAFARSIFGPEDASIREGGGGEENWDGEGLEAAATSRIVRARGYSGLAPGEAFARALGVAMALGCLSPRRAFLSRQPDYKPYFASSSNTGQGVVEASRAIVGEVPSQGVGGARAAVMAPSATRSKVGRPLTCWAQELALRGSWHEVLAERDLKVGSQLGVFFEQRYLRWNGWLIRYAVGGSSDPSAAALVLVHGFGASCDQWDGIFRELSQITSEVSGEEDGNGNVQCGELPRGIRLVALDMVGFGHSSKPPLSYSQYSWADCVRDVALRVVGGPFFIAGNSIGGYISMGVAADCGNLCQGVILVNSAGRLLTLEEFEEESTEKFAGLSVEAATRQGKLGSYSAPPNLVLSILGGGLFAFLQGRIAETCRNVYPVNPQVVDEGLAEDILRDSCDPGAVGVIAAGGKLPFSRSANEMLRKFQGPVLVTQGVKDPLNDAEGRAAMFESLGPQVEVVRLNGGHCPHHEVAEEVSNAMLKFVTRNNIGVEEVMPVTGRGR